jgi:GT2 family glycosyltransferase
VPAIFRRDSICPSSLRETETGRIPLTFASASGCEQVTFPRIASVIINYKTPGLTLDCLSSLEPNIADLPDSQAIVVDNASRDDSASILRREISARCWDSWADVVEAPNNAGFSAGNNRGIAAAQSRAEFDAYLLANSDTILRPGALRALGQRLMSSPTVGLVGPRLEWPSGELQASCFRAISPVSELAAAAKTGVLSRLVGGDLPIPTDQQNGAGAEALQWISFACVLIRAEAFAKIGPMDEGFFMYFEDVDYCRRARRSGWQLAYEPEAHVVHLRGGRSPEDFAREECQRRPRFYYESRSRYLAKYYGRTGPLSANFCWTLGRGISLVRELAANKSPHTAAREAGDIWTGALCGFSKHFMNQPVQA